MRALTDFYGEEQTGRPPSDRVLHKLGLAGLLGNWLLGSGRHPGAQEETAPAGNQGVRETVACT